MKINIEVEDFTKPCEGVFSDLDLYFYKLAYFTLPNHMRQCFVGHSQFFSFFSSKLNEPLVLGST